MQIDVVVKTSPDQSVEKVKSENSPKVNKNNRLETMDLSSALNDEVLFTTDKDEIQFLS